MEVVFDSEAFKLGYDKETDSCVMRFTSYGDRDKFRTPMMHAVEMIRKYKCTSLIIADECKSSESLSNINEADLRWVKKVIIPKLATTSCEHIYFVVDEDEAGTSCDEVPYSLFNDKFKTDKVVSEQFALMMIRKGCQVEESSKIESMTRTQALEYMNLPADANDFAIDERFWKLSKQIRGDNTPEGRQKIADLSAAYDIATGRRDERVRKAAVREQERKIFGKTGDEWRTYFSYTWYRYLIAVILIALAGNLIYTVAFKPRYDCGYLSLGHFENESDYVEKFLTTRMGFVNPMMGTVDVVIPNDQGQSQQAYADQSAATLMISRPNVIVFDEVTMPYYFSNLADFSSAYECLRENLTDEQFRKLRPIYLSERDSQALLMEYERNYGAELNAYDDDLSYYDDTPVMVGVELTDEAAISALGYNNLWPDYEPSLVFSVYSDTMSYVDSEQIIMQLLRSVL